MDTWKKYMCIRPALHDVPIVFMKKKTGLERTENRKENAEIQAEHLVNLLRRKDNFICHSRDVSKFTAAKANLP